MHFPLDPFTLVGRSVWPSTGHLPLSNPLVIEDPFDLGAVSSTDPVTLPASPAILEMPSKNWSIRIMFLAFTWFLSEKPVSLVAYLVGFIERVQDSKAMPLVLGPLPFIGLPYVAIYAPSDPFQQPVFYVSLLESSWFRYPKSKTLRLMCLMIVEARVERTIWDYNPFLVSKSP